jgi:glycosyltransferase involved in cell wall biosynthesis
VSVQFPFYQNFRISLNPMREVKMILDDFEPEVIHIQMLMWIGQAAMKYGNKQGIPIVSTNHAMPENLMDNLRMLAPVSRPINYILTEYGRRFHSRADCVTMPTQSAIDMFQKTDKMDVPLKAVSNGIDLGHFTADAPSDAIYEKFNLPKDVPIVSYVGRLDAEKHLSVLIKAFTSVRHEVDAHMLIVGDGTDAGNLRELVRVAGLTDHVTFTGRVSDEDLVELHRVGTVFAMPSPAELQSIATLEAMASGQPIVAVDAGALGELCQDGRNGVLCEKDHDRDMAQGIISIITDPERRAAFSKESLAIAHTHDINHTLDEFLAIYDQVMR